MLGCLLVSGWWWVVGGGGCSMLLRRPPAWLAAESSSWGSAVTSPCTQFGWSLIMREVTLTHHQPLPVLWLWQTNTSPAQHNNNQHRGRTSITLYSQHNISGIKLLWKNSNFIFVVMSSIFPSSGFSSHNILSNVKLFISCKLLFIFGQNSHIQLNVCLSSLNKQDVDNKGDFTSFLLSRLH